MKLTLKAKIFLLIVFSALFIAVPIITLTYGNLKKISRQFEEESFDNVMLLMEDNIQSRYLNLLSSEIMAVLNQKIHLQTSAYIAKNTWNNINFLNEDQKSQFFSSLIVSLDAVDISAGIFENGEIKNQSVYFDMLLKNPFRTDYKGIILNQMIHSNSLTQNGTFAVFRFSDTESSILNPESSENISLLFYFLAIDKNHVIALGSLFTDVSKSGQVSEHTIVQSLQEKLDSLYLYPSSIMCLFSADKEILATHGTVSEQMLADLPYELIAKVREHKFATFYYNDEDIPAKSSYKPWGDTIFRLFYFKSLDWYILAAVPVDEIQANSNTLLFRLIMIAGAVVFVCVLLGLLLAYRTIRPLQTLIHKVLGLAKADLSDLAEKQDTFGKQKVLTEFAQNLPIERTDEVGQLAQAFAKMGQALEINIKNLLQSQALTERIQGELSTARDIQMGILRDKNLFPYNEEFAVSAFLEPAKEVGGDLYDYFELADGRKAFVVGDVSGKGVPAALFMSMTVTLIRYALNSGLAPAQAMQKINDTLSENNPSLMFVTLFIGILDERTGNFEYANGGHCFPCIFNTGTKDFRLLENLSGPLVGAMGDMDYTGYTDSIAHEDICFFYTDGVTEAMNENNQLYGDERLRQRMYSSLEKFGNDYGQNPAKLLVDAVYQDILVYRQKAEQSDDITMLCFMRR